MLQNCTLMVLHIPKAAGTTLRWVMDRQYPEDSIYKIRSDIVGDQIKLRSMPSGEKCKLRAIFGHYCYGLHTALPAGQRFAYVTILRDPVQRLISLWAYARMGSPDHYLYDVTQDMSFSDFVTCGVARYTDNGQVRQLCGADRFTMYDSQQIPYGDMLIPFGDITEHHLSMAMDNLSSFACVGVVSSFDGFLDRMRRLFSWRIPLYRKKNVTRTKPPLTNEELDITAHGYSTGDAVRYSKYGGSDAI